jgi:DNA gyrase inhibitor GyrI
MTTQTIDVRVVRLEPLRVASAPGFGPSPEAQAWEKLMAWARAQGLADKLKAHRFFGFNNPSPAPGSPNYGYEQWITVGPEVAGTEKIEVKEFPGGLYAVARCHGVPEIGSTWKALLAWLEDSAYRYGPHQCLEECYDPPRDPAASFEHVVFDLYLPLTE